FQQIDVVNKQIHRTNGDQPGGEEPVSAGKRQQRTCSESKSHRVFDDPALEMCLTIVRQDDALMAEQFTDGIIHRATGADVFRASQLLFDKAIELCFSFAACLLMWHCNILKPPQDDDGDKGEYCKSQPCAPIFEEERNQDTDQQ